MPRKTRPPKPPKARRNPMARELSAGIYKAKVVPKPDAYRRSAKHRKPAAIEEE